MVAKLTIQFSGWPPYCKNTFLLIQADKRTKRDATGGTVYLGVDELGVCEVFL